MALNKNKKNFILRLFFSQFFLAMFGLIIIILISFPLVKNVSRGYKTNQEIKKLEKEIANLESKSSNFKDIISYLESEQFVEEQARLKLGLKKQGESAAVIKSKLNKAEDNSATTSSSIFNIPGLSKTDLVKQINNLQRWQKYFFK